VDQNLEHRPENGITTGASHIMARIAHDLAPNEVPHHIEHP
jgi:hypothetical protein